MYFLSWIIIGLITGWLMRRVLGEGGYGPVLDIVMGIAGAVAGGSIMRLASTPAHRGLAYTALAALFGAGTLTVINAVYTSRKRYA